MNDVKNTLHEIDFINDSNETLEQSVNCFNSGVNLPVEIFFADLLF